jgi:hypothetical protein
MLPTLKFLLSCKLGSLLRVRINDNAEFAILGAPTPHSQGIQYLVILRQDDSPLAINIFGATGLIEDQFETYPVLVFGEFEIAPELAGRCEIGDGPRSSLQKPGCIRPYR